MFDRDQIIGLERATGRDEVDDGVSKTGDGGRVYDIAHYQIVQGNLLRAYQNFRGGRRIVAQPMTVPANANVPNASGPAGSVKIAADGSTAAFVPANRALSWQTTDASGTPIVRESFMNRGSHFCPRCQRVTIVHTT